MIRGGHRRKRQGGLLGCGQSLGCVSRELVCAGVEPKLRTRRGRSRAQEANHGLTVLAEDGGEAHLDGG